jgi:hypothetical protein
LPKTVPHHQNTPPGLAIFLTGCEKEEPQIIPVPSPKVVSTCSDITKCHKKIPKRERRFLYYLKFSAL